MGASNQDGHNQVPTNTAIRILNKPYTPNDCTLYEDSNPSCQIKLQKSDPIDSYCKESSFTL